MNFEAAWDEVGDEFEKEETFTLSTIKTLEGNNLGDNPGWPLATVDVYLPFAYLGPGP